MSDPSQRPLVLDVDGTMIRSDLTHELLFEGFRTAKPWHWPRLLRLALTNKPALKAEFVARIGDRMAPELHPLEPLAVELAEAATAEGREVYLCSGSEQSLVERLAAVLPYVDGAFGTVPGYNMTAQNKADFLTERFPDGFDYVGNSSQDYEPWEAAHTAFAIRPPEDAKFRTSASGERINILEHRYRQLIPSPPQTTERKSSYLVGLALAVFLGSAFYLASSGTMRLTGLLAAPPIIGLLSYAVSLWTTATRTGRDRRDPQRSNPISKGDLSVTTALRWSIVTIVASFMLAAFFGETEAIAAWAICLALLAVWHRQS